MINRIEPDEPRRYLTLYSTSRKDQASMTSQFIARANVA
jgi:hypothetical protein